MKLLADRRLEFLYKHATEREIARQTGIPRSTLYDIKTHKYKASEKHYNTVRNYFQRKSFSLLREAGASSLKADRYKWYRPESVTETIKRINSVVGYLTNTNLQTHLKKLDKQGIAYDPVEEAEALAEAIKAKLRKSKKDLEKWEAYL